MYSKRIPLFVILKGIIHLGEKFLRENITPRFLLKRDKHVTWAGDTLKEHAKSLTCKLYHFFLSAAYK